MYLTHDLEQQIFCQRRHLRPVLDVRSELDLSFLISDAVAVKYAVGVNLAVKEISRIRIAAGVIFCGSESSLVGCGRGY